MTRTYQLTVLVPDGAVLELSTSYPRPRRIVDNSRKLSTSPTAEHAREHSTESADLGRSVGSGERGYATHGDPETSLTETDLIHAYGGLHVVDD